MSVNIQTPNGLVKVSGDKVTKKKVVDALGYTPANEKNHYTKEEINNRFDDNIEVATIVCNNISYQHLSITYKQMREIYEAYRSGKIIMLVDSDTTKYTPYKCVVSQAYFQSAGGSGYFHISTMHIDPSDPSNGICHFKHFHAFIDDMYDPDKSEKKVLGKVYHLAEVDHNHDDAYASKTHSHYTSAIEDKDTGFYLDEILGYKANSKDVYTKTEVDTKITENAEIEIIQISSNAGLLQCSEAKQIYEAHQNGKIVYLEYKNAETNTISRRLVLRTWSFCYANETVPTIQIYVLHGSYSIHCYRCRIDAETGYTNRTSYDFALENHNHDSSYYQKSETYTRQEVDQQVNENNQYLLGEVDTKFNDYYNQGEVDDEIATAYDNVLAEVDTKIQNRTGKVVYIDVRPNSGNIAEMSNGDLKAIYNAYLANNHAIVRLICNDTNGDRIEAYYNVRCIDIYSGGQYMVITIDSNSGFYSFTYVTDQDDADINNGIYYEYAHTRYTYNKTEIDTLFGNYYDMEEVDNKIAEAATGGNVDLSNYATKEELATKVEPFILEVTGVDVITVAQGIQIYNAFHAGQPTIIRIVDADGVFDMNIIVQAAFCIMSASYAIVACAGNEMIGLEFEYDGTNDSDIVSSHDGVLITQEDLESYLESYADKSHTHDEYALKTEIPSLGDYYTSGEVDIEIANQIAAEKPIILAEVDNQIDSKIAAYMAANYENGNTGSY